MAGDPAANVGYTHHIDGAIAGIRIYDRGFTPLECWNASGFKSAYLIAPPRGATLDAVSTTLKWEMGTPGVASYALYVGTAKEQLESAAATRAANQDPFPLAVTHLTDTHYGPLQLALGTTYDTAGMISLGERFARAMLDLENKR